MVKKKLKKRKVKPGYKTSEFWMTVLTIIGSWAAVIKDYMPPKIATIASAVTVSAYTIARGLKKGASQQEINLIQEAPSGEKEKTR